MVVIAIWQNIPYNKFMNWNVYFSRNAAKQAEKLNKKIMSILGLLIEDLRENGPFPGKQWPNYGKLQGQKTDIRHCHLVKGKPTYVCCWEIVDKQKKIIEVSYVGSHEKAPY
jgi:mRNA-degrading endonuclease RelE of RelBE toxin-antitoxin system